MVKLLLNFAFRFAIHFHSRSLGQIAKLPFTMIEDILESLTIEKAEEMWLIVESHLESITHPELFPKGGVFIYKLKYN
jgi:hypothetical protein